MNTKQPKYRLINFLLEQQDPDLFEYLQKQVSLYRNIALGKEKMNNTFIVSEPQVSYESTSSRIRAFLKFPERMGIQEPLSQLLSDI